MPVSTCVLSVGGGGGGGGVVFPVLLSVTAAGRRTRRKAFCGVRPGGDRNTNQQMTHANITTTKTTDKRGHVTDTYANTMHTHRHAHTQMWQNKVRHRDTNLQALPVVPHYIIVLS